MTHWTYEVATGYFTSPDGHGAGAGYSGNGAGLDNPVMEAVHGVGPIPKGNWKINLTPIPESETDTGPLSLALTPVGHDAHGRTLFRIHGDNKLMNHSASKGCIIASRSIRQAIIDSGVSDLVVE